ncbi:MAG: hypothetical protein WCT46_04720 [Candidatus Gracilibacteria bacterium]
MQKNTLKCTLLARDLDKLTISIETQLGYMVTMYFPSSTIPEEYEIGDEFYLHITEEKPESKNKNSIEDMRQLLYELIN